MDLLEQIFKTIHNTVKLYNELSPEARHVMNQYLLQNKQKTLDHQLSKDLRSNPLYRAINEKNNISFNPILISNSKTRKNKSTRSQGSRSRQGSRKQSRRTRQGSRKQSRRNSQYSRKQSRRSRQGSRKRKFNSK